jgi:hypothetical protein
MSEPNATDAPGIQVPGAPSDNVSQVAVLESLAADGYPNSLHPAEDGSLRCGACERSSDAEDLRDLQTRRMEGASDPDDMTIVVAARCPECGEGGTVVLGYGPNASAADAAVVVRLPNP